MVSGGMVNGGRADLPREGSGRSKEACRRGTDPPPFAGEPYCDGSPDPD